MDDQMRELLLRCDAALKGAANAADQLMSEFISRKHAADWGVINDGLVAANVARAAIKEKLES